MKDTDYKTKSFFEKDAKVKYYCDDSNADKLLREIIFLYRKLMDLKSKIESAYEDFVKSTVDVFEEDARKQARKVKKDDNEVNVKHVFISSQADNDLFFYLDTLLIDLKRIVEFSFRLLARFEDFGELENFSFENLIGWLSGENKISPSGFAKTLMTKYPSYIKFISSNKKWLKSLNYRRTQSIHYEIFNKSGEFTIEYLWNSVMNVESKPLITFPKIPFFDKLIPEFVGEETDNLKEFMNKTLGLRQDLIKGTKII